MLRRLESIFRDEKKFVQKIYLSKFFWIFLFEIFFWILFFLKISFTSEYQLEDEMILVNFQRRRVKIRLWCHISKKWLWRKSKPWIIQIKYRKESIFITIRINTQPVKFCDSSGNKINLWNFRNLLTLSCHEMTNSDPVRRIESTHAIDMLTDSPFQIFLLKLKRWPRENWKVAIPGFL